MLTSENYDVVVVGAGNTALITALAAREAGARVLVLEKAPEVARGGNGYFTTGTYRCVHRGIEEVREVMPDLTEEEAALDIPPYTADSFYNEMMRITEGMVDPELLEVIVGNSNGVIRWLRESLGIRFELPSISLRHFAGRLVLFQAELFSYGLYVSRNGNGSGNSHKIGSAHIQQLC